MDDELDDEREDARRIWSDDERPITLSRLLGESPEDAARRPQPPPPELKGSPSRSLLFVGFSAVVVACLVALGALVTHSGQFAVHVDRQLSGLSEDGAASEPGDLRPAIPPAAAAPTSGAAPTSAAIPGLPAGPGAGPEARPAPSPGAIGDGSGSGTGRDSAGPGAARGASVSERASSENRSGTARDADSDAGGGTGDGDGRGRDGERRRERGDAARSDPSGGSSSGSGDAGSGGGLLESVDSVLEGLTDVGGHGGPDVRFMDSWHDAAGHDRSGRGPDHPDLRATPTGVAPGLRLP